jgi:hypothetical protein
MGRGGSGCMTGKGDHNCSTGGEGNRPRDGRGAHKCTETCEEVKVIEKVIEKK